MGAAVTRLKVTTYGEIVCDLGEGPLWSVAEGALYWIDVTGRRLHRQATPGEAESWELPHMPGCFAFRAGGGLIGAFRNRLGFFDPVTGDIDAFEGHDIDFGRERFNDGACDARGRLWAGTFDPSLKTASGSLYRIDPDRSVHRMDTGISMSNGMTWSPDGTTMYYSDSRPGRMYQYAFDMESGAVGPREVFLDYANKEGRPDGCTMDAEGHLWVAEVTAGRVSCYDPQGKLVRSIHLPVSKPTSVAFGGSGLSSLFVTTMRNGLSEAELAEEPLAGRVLRIELDVRGLPETPFSA